jgi:hypothetical protein
MPSQAKSARFVVGECEVAIAAAERKYAIPAGLLLAIGRTEAFYSKEQRIWPFAANRRGESFFFADRQEMVEFLRVNLPVVGWRGVDVGCMQVNFGWHGHRIDDPFKLLDPWFNAQYAAFHLLELYGKSGDWTKAVASYHSQNAGRQKSYVAAVNGQWILLQNSGIVRGALAKVDVRSRDFRQAAALLPRSKSVEMARLGDPNRVSVLREN